MGFVNGPADPSFNLFLQLPSEIRLAIWRLALPPPRLISWASDDENYDYMIRYGSWSRSSEKYKRSKRKAPPDKQARSRFYGIFHACKESRSEALKLYKILASNPEADVKFELPKWAPLYVNIYHDIFVVPYPGSGTDYLPRDLHELLITYGEQLELLRTIATCELIIRARDKGEAAYNKLHRICPNATRMILLYQRGTPLNSDGVYCPPYLGHEEAVNKEYQVMRAAHPEWSIKSVEVKTYDGSPLPTVPLPVGKEIDLDAIYERKLKM
jgi:2EXR family